jgi:1-acyl-sn-glycerol-3-phosphate acyltransferase
MFWKSIYHFLHLLVYLLAKPLFRYRAIGTEHIPRQGSGIIASNHASYLDPIFVGLGIRRRINYLAKKELFSNRLAGYFLRNLLRALPIDRERMDRNTLRETYNLLKTNELVLMFPEGTRTYDGKLNPAKMGIGMIAYNTKVPVIPVYIDGSYTILSRTTTAIRFKNCSVYYGPPVDLHAFYTQQRSKELYKAISEKIMDAISTLEERASDTREPC